MGTLTYDFTGETAVVTGGSSGLGRQIALAFATAGASVLVGDIREETLDEGAEAPTHEVVRDRGGEAEYVETDVADPDAVAALVDRARDYGGVDHMVNNAGISDTGVPFDEITFESFENLMAINVGGVLFGCQAAATDMLDRGAEGTIVNTASIRSDFAHPKQVQYDASKGAVRMVTRAMAYDLAETGIRVNAVAPGPIATDGRIDRGAEEIRADVAEGKYVKPVPQMRAGEPEEVANAVLFLASDRASYTIGELLHVDGGYQIY